MFSPKLPSNQKVFGINCSEIYIFRIVWRRYIIRLGYQGMSSCQLSTSFTGFQNGGKRFRRSVSTYPAIFVRIGRVFGFANFRRHLRVSKMAANDLGCRFLRTQQFSSESGYSYRPWLEFNVSANFWRPF